MSDQLKLDSLRHKAVSDFYELRRKADVESIMGFLRGKTTDLMAYDQVRQNLRPIESARRILEDIPLNKIVGSVNRTTDFSRSFLPRNTSDATRWANVKVGVESQAGLPPIEAYRVGDVYFILDGHHRVSVARELRAETIQGYVIPVSTRVPLLPGDSPDDLIIKSEYADFLASTQMDYIRPDANLMVSVPGQFQKLLEHINVHRYFIGSKRKADVPMKEAAADWYDEVYIPVANVIRRRNLLRDFPNRTETDLYLWIMDHRAALSGGVIGWEISVEKVASDLAIRFSQAPNRRLPRIAHRVLDNLVPEPFEPVPPSGLWRAERQSPHRGDRLFDDIQVTIPGGSIGQAAIRLAVEISRLEEARLTGLHVVASEEQKQSEEVRKLQEEFVMRCSENGIFGRMLIEVSQNAAEVLSHRSSWTDLSVFRLAYPPPNKMFKRLRSGVRYLIRHCVSPLLAVPDSGSIGKITSALLAYGPGRKSDEALFVAAYIAASWQIPLTVVSVMPENRSGNNPSPILIDRARAYLEAQQVQASYIIEEMVDPALAVLLNAERENAGLIITGSYEGSLLKEAFRGSTVDRVLRSTRRPVLICR